MSTAGAAVVAWCGMRGIVTLAAALALPDGGGAAFPYRDFILFTAFSVVLGTLVVQGMTVGPLMKLVRLRDDGSVDREVRLARAETARAALAAVDGTAATTMRRTRDGRLPPAEVPGATAPGRAGRRRPRSAEADGWRDFGERAATGLRGGAADAVGPSRARRDRRRRVPPGGRGARLGRSERGEPAVVSDVGDRTLPRIRQTPLAAAIVAIAFGIAVLGGYVLTIGRLLPLPQFVLPTQPLAAVLILLTGTSLLAAHLRRARIQRDLALVATLLAALIVAEYLFGVDLHIDRLLFPNQVASLSRIFPGRPAPVTAATLLLQSLALLLAARRPGQRPGPHADRHRARRGHPADGPDRGPSRRRLRAAQLLGPARDRAAHRGVLLLLSCGVAAATQESAVLLLLRGRDPGTTLLRLLLRWRCCCRCSSRRAACWRSGSASTRSTSAGGVRLGVHRDVRGGGVLGGRHRAPGRCRAPRRRAGAGGAGAARPAARGRDRGAAALHARASSRRASCSRSSPTPR